MLRLLPGSGPDNPGGQTPLVPSGPLVMGTKTWGASPNSPSLSSPCILE